MHVGSFELRWVIIGISCFIIVIWRVCLNGGSRYQLSTEVQHVIAYVKLDVWSNDASKTTKRTQIVK